MLTASRNRRIKAFSGFFIFFPDYAHPVDNVPFFISFQDCWWKLLRFLLYLTITSSGGWFKISLSFIISLLGMFNDIKLTCASSVQSPWVLFGVVCMCFGPLWLICSRLLLSFILNTFKLATTVNNFNLIVNFSRHSSIDGKNLHYAGAHHLDGRQVLGKLSSMDW